jgi:hypothetical protein
MSLTRVVAIRAASLDDVKITMMNGDNDGGSLYWTGQQYRKKTGLNADCCRAAGSTALVMQYHSD